MASDANAVPRNPNPGAAVGNTAYAAVPAGRTSPGSNASNETGFSAATGYLSGTADTASALTHLGARDYDAVLGIFTAPDPVLDLADAKNFSPYAYSEHDPVNQADPSGLRPTCDCSDDGIHYAPEPGPGTGFPGKSEFPQGWSDGRIMHEISDVATDPSLTWRAGNRSGDFFVNGTRGGTDIEVLIRNDQIWTGYPTNVARKPW